VIPDLAQLGEYWFEIKLGVVVCLAVAFGAVAEAVRQDWKRHHGKS
jgi:hypothetical protein